MNRTVAVASLAALVALAAAARADDPKPAAPAPAGAPAAPAGADKPAPAAKHENKVTTEAAAAFEKMAKLTNALPVRGVKEASGTLTTEIAQLGMQISMKFTFKAPRSLTVEADPNLQGQMEMMGNGIARMSESVFRSALGLCEPSSDAEYDADLAKKDGKDVLSITRFKDGAETAHNDITLDANGLIATTSLRMQMSRGPEKREVKSDAVYTWSKNGDAWRLDKIESTDRRGTSTAQITYCGEGAACLPASWKATNPMGEMEIKVADLVVDGKKVDTTKAAPAAKPEGEKKDAPKAQAPGGKKGDGDEEDEDDDDDEKGEKGEGHGK